MWKLTGVSLLTGFLCLRAIAFDGPSPPRSIPFSQDGKTYNAYVQTWHPHYAQSNICYYPTNYDPSLAPILATDGIVQFGFLSITRLLLNPTSSAQSWDSILFASDGPLCAMYWSGAWNDPVSRPTRIFYQQYGWNDWYFNGQYNYRLNLQTDLVRAVGIDVRANFTYDYAGQFGLNQVVAGQVVVTGSPPPPLPSASPPLPIGGGWILTRREYSNFASRQYFDSKAYKGLNHIGDDLALSADGSRTASSTTIGKQVHPICSGFVERIEARKAVEESYIVVRHPSCVGQALFAYYGHLQPCERADPTCPDALSPGSPVSTASVLGVIKDWGANSHLHLTLDTWLDRSLPESASYVCNHTFAPYDGSFSITAISECTKASKIPRGETEKVLLTRLGWGRLTATLRTDGAGNTERGPFYITPTAMRHFGFVSYFDLN